MEWLAGVFALLLLLFIALYRKSLKESRDLTNFALLILLDEGVCAKQREALTELVRSIDARNAGDLGAKVNLATTQLAARLGHTFSVPLDCFGSSEKIHHCHDSRPSTYSANHRAEYLGIHLRLSTARPV